MMGNAGFLFYKRYYQEFEEDDWKQIASAKRGGDEKLSKKAKNSIAYTNRALTAIQVPCDNGSPDLGNHRFELKTLNPGLLIGSSYAHEAGVVEEYKIGFYFDYTTGLPTIPGSSIKGVLRSVFPKETDPLKEQKEDYLNQKLKEIGRTPIDSLFEIEQEIFDGIVNGQRVPITQRDIFFDAPVAKSTNTKKAIFGHDFITPHKDPLSDPIPIKFLKVLPEVIFRFQFQLHKHNTISQDDKLALFKEILLDIGVGAKTNVGYGQFDFASV